MMNRTVWLNRLALALIWIVITAGIAFLVARNGAADDDGADVTTAAPPIAAEQRSAVTLTERTISPVVAGDGGVVWDGENDRWLLVAPAEPADLAYRLLDDPSVVFTQDYGPHNLRLGAWDCFNEFSYPWGGLNHQDHNVLRFVADGVPNQFCMVTDVSSGSGGSFGGYLQWD
jgi:hypothetical protein